MYESELCKLHCLLILICLNFNCLLLKRVNIFSPVPDISQHNGPFPALPTQSDFLRLQLFAVEEAENIIPAYDISQYNEPFPATVDALTDGESSEEEENEPVDSDYTSDELEFLEREKKREINESLDNFLELEKGMSFKDLDEAKMFVIFYSIVKKRGLKVTKSDPTRVRYRCDVGCSFVCLISKVAKGQGFEVKTLEIEHTCQPCFKNRRATQQALANYFKNKI